MAATSEAGPRHPCRRFKTMEDPGRKMQFGRHHPQNCPGSPPDSRGPQMRCRCCEELRAPVSEGNDLDIPQCWPVPFRTCARRKKPRDPSRWPPRLARSWTGLCEWPPRPSRGSKRSTLRCPSLLFPDANSGLVGCLGSSDVEFDTGCSLDTAPANPRQAQTTKVCATARVLRLPSGRLHAAGAFTGRAVPRAKVRWSRCSCEVRLLGFCSASCLCCLEVPPSGQE